ncbi:MAG: ExeM/NucH family extracellular endonuclease [Bacteroidales bacterium]|nr:ExeM/NucH family extracellular endonuclease [Bacteroidales bacterium]
MRLYLIFLLAAICIGISAQTVVSIPQIQGSSTSSPYNSTTVKTTGIVTAKFIGTGKINGYFLQDETGDGNNSTSDGIFVSTSTNDVSVGDKIEVTATVSENGSRTQLGSITNQSILSSNNPLPIKKVVYDNTNWNWEAYEGMLLEFDQTLFVTSNYNLLRYGQLTLNPSRIYTPTNQCLPNSAEYTNLVQQNQRPQLTLDDAITTSNFTPIQFADNSGTRRTGERVNNMRVIVDNVSSKFYLYPAEQIQFYGNPRPIAPSELGNYNLKVCAANLEIFLVENFDPTYGGPRDDIEAAKQLAKITAAMVAIDADVYGLVEVQQGQNALIKLVNAMNTATATGRYSFVNDGGVASGTYTKAAFVYRTDKVTPYLALKNNNVSPTNRKKAQAFTLKSNGERFIFCINHYKAKSGCSSATGLDADLGDGQSCYNASRVNEASSTVNTSIANKTYYGDEDVLIMGDLNAYGKEDPIQYLIKNGYTDLHRAFHADSAYSYSYNNEAGYLDNALCSASLLPQVTGVSVFHVNADEPAMFGYADAGFQPDMYRYSDHDPVVVGLALGKTQIDNPISKDSIKIQPTLVSDFFTVKNANNSEIEIINLNGKIVGTAKITSEEQQINISKYHLISGVYMIRFTDQDVIKRLMVR